MAVLTALLLVACDDGDVVGAPAAKQRVPVAVELVPDGVNIILQLELGKALADEDIARLYEALPKEG